MLLEEFDCLFFSLAVLFTYKLQVKEILIGLLSFFMANAMLFLPMNLFPCSTCFPTNISDNHNLTYFSQSYHKRKIHFCKHLELFGRKFQTYFCLILLSSLFFIHIYLSFWQHQTSQGYVYNYVIHLCNRYSTILNKSPQTSFQYKTKQDIIIDISNCCKTTSKFILYRRPQRRKVTLRHMIFCEDNFT